MHITKNIEQMKKIENKQLASVLREMADYVESSEDNSYFREIAKTGLFSDAMGKIVIVTDDHALVVTDY